jgi:DNA-binding response OmpR family regulator
MQNELDKTNEVAVYDLTELLQVAANQVWPANDLRPERPPAYRLALGREPIQLGIVECRILLYLAGRPYYAFTRRNIADAVSTERHPVREDTVDIHVDSLIDQLGEFHDYIQAVPYVGYRFKE